MEQPGTIGDMSAGDKVINSLFFAVTPRTAGHYTVDMNNFTDGSYLLTNLLMFVGGSQARRRAASRPPPPPYSYSPWCPPRAANARCASASVA